LELCRLDHNRIEQLASSHVTTVSDLEKAAMQNHLAAASPGPLPEKEGNRWMTRPKNKAFEITTKRAKISIRPVGQKIAYSHPETALG
jgi:hypothetical protein